jgi:hypothetical protein
MVRCMAVLYMFKVAYYCHDTRRWLFSFNSDAALRVGFAGRAIKCGASIKLNNETAFVVISLAS